MLKIDLYSDVVCPWCIIGQHRLDKVLSERFPHLDVDIEHHPYELMPHAPPEGIKLADYFGMKGIADMALAFQRPEAEARASGLHLELGRQPFVYRTIQAHTLLRAARARGTQHALAGALMKAYFHERRNISDSETLGEIAADHGFTSAEARSLVQDEAQLKATAAEIAQTRTAGVTSVPTFDISGIAIVGGRTEDGIASAIEQAARRPVRTSA